ncbi:G-type lectin S-receptor-like serine/threonine-protein kinase At1g11330 isoform X2 [Prosopis cineraria]|uniref:G-type lectin S-receptor-like serine/threonine-protein kinase At1g11330 isoform X2 n=1 Tax=Prosopis cineraria TaxID=364024 RepID=UPI00240F9B94|nr:G-type lectin S-receptor-like serine/threonine-protein kinase At1g11330 isoform X2 [Prosopis cineraria]
MLRIMCKDIVRALLIISCFCLYSGSSMDFNDSFQLIKDADTVSSGTFKLGFFSPENSTNRYVGIWYLDESTAIWVANRNNPLRDSFGIFTISEDGNLVVLNDQNLTLWSSNVPNIPPNSSMAQLLDTGNLVLNDSTTGKALWESFQHPSDSFIPKMKLVRNPGTGEKPTVLTSWKSPSDPSTGSFSASLERLDAPEVVVYNGSKPYWRSGPWNGREFLGVPFSSNIDRFSLKANNGTYSISFDLANPSYFGVFKLSSTGKWVITGWSNKIAVGRWRIQHNECDVYGQCGEFGYCNPQSAPICSCLDGFEPKNADEWNKQNWKNGCIRKEPLQCDKRIKNGSEDRFNKLEKVKTPDFVQRLQVPDEENCRKQCLQNCSCLAYAYDLAIRCMSWSGKLIDIRTFAPGGFDLYIRPANSELEKPAENVTDKMGDKRRSNWKVIVIAISLIMGATILAACSYFLWKIVARLKGKTNQNGLSEGMIGDSKQEKLEELPLFEFEKLAIATNNFHNSNRLGQGGFGPVYKGELQDSQVIAVKRLSRGSGQGLEEFMNEVRVISKLQHRNLVRLLGCCIEGDEKMLVYEYMPNKSLDAVLFGRKIWTEDNIKSLIDPEIYDSSFHMEILRCIQVGLLCVQELAKDRPSMAFVYSMLNSEIVNLPSPTQPAFTKRQYTMSEESSQQKDPIYSNNTHAH